MGFATIMESERTILHVDMDAFFASVEQHDKPDLKGRPLVVGAPPDRRGVVSAASYEARKYGIHSAMPSRTAAKLCPEAVFLPVDMPRYKKASAEVFAIFERFTPLVEPLSIDEAFLDVSGCLRLFGDGPAIARKIKDAIFVETGLRASVGVAMNKFLAKLASDMDKPDGLTVVPRDIAGVQEFLAPLLVEKLWGVGKATREILNEAGIYRVGHLQSAELERLKTVLGEHAAMHLQRLAYGRDDREIQTVHEEKSISREYTFEEDAEEWAVIRATLARLVDKVGQHLRRSGLLAGTARVKLRWKGFTTITRQIALNPPACDNDTLLEAAMQIFERIELKDPVRLVGFGVSKFEQKRAQQLSLFGKDDAMQEKRIRLSRAVDEIVSEYGDDSIRRGGGM